MEGWSKVYTTQNYTEANILKGMLEENHIQVAILNKLDSNYLSFGDIEIYVPKYFIHIASNLVNGSLMN
jgi:hypothetical protein